MLGRVPIAQNEKTNLCECAHSVAQRFSDSQRLQCTHQVNEVMRHNVERALQCADGGIDGQDSVHTLFLFDPRQSH